MTTSGGQFFHTFGVGDSVSRSYLEGQCSKAAGICVRNGSVGHSTTSHSCPSFLIFTIMKQIKFFACPYLKKKLDGYQNESLIHIDTQNYSKLRQLL